jgi:hypothetical protein
VNEIRSKRHQEAVSLGPHTLPGSNEKSKDSSDGSDLDTPLIHQKTVTWQNLLALLAVAAQTGMTRLCKLSGGNSHFPTTVNGTKILKMDGPISQPNQALEVEFYVPPEWKLPMAPPPAAELRQDLRIPGAAAAERRRHMLTSWGGGGGVDGVVRGGG